MILDILRETLEVLNSSNGAFHSARKEAANDMLKYMRIVFPIATKTQILILADHGYSSENGKPIGQINCTKSATVIYVFTLCFNIISRPTIECLENP